MTRHILIGSDPDLGLRAIKGHFIPWIRTVGLQDFQTNSSQHRFTVRVANETTGDLEITLPSRSRLLIQSRRWRYHLAKSIQAPGLKGTFGEAYLAVLTEQFFEHLRGDCACFGPTTNTTAQIVNKRPSGTWGQQPVQILCEE